LQAGQKAVVSFDLMFRKIMVPKAAAAICLLPLSLFLFISRIPCWGQSLSTNLQPLKYEEPRFLQGAIYSSDRKELLLRFTRRATRAGQQLNVVRDYTYPNGKIAARERVEYQGDELTSFMVQELQTGGTGSAKLTRDRGATLPPIIEFNYQKDPGSKPKTRSEDLVPGTMISDMLPLFLVSHWTPLMQGEKVKCRLIVLPRRETVGFTFVKQSESIRKGQKVVIVKMDPTSPLISALVDPLFFTLETEGQHHVVEYSGRTTPKIRDGNSWKDLDGVTVFDWADKAGKPEP
jgi:hypothetical protein